MLSKKRSKIAGIIFCIIIVITFSYLLVDRVVQDRKTDLLYFDSFERIYTFVSYEEKTDLKYGSYYVIHCGGSVNMIIRGIAYKEVDLGNLNILQEGDDFRCHTLYFHRSIDDQFVSFEIVSMSMDNVNILSVGSYVDAYHRESVFIIVAYLVLVICGLSLGIFCVIGLRKRK